MGKLMTSPITIQGELHDVHLFNFSVAPEEILPLVPKPLKPVLDEDRGWISLVDVHLKNMRPMGLPKWLGLNYHHIAYRVLVDCPVQGDAGETEWQRGIYFLESFSNNPWICLAGNLISEYRFLQADIQEEASPEHRSLECRSDDGQHVISAKCDYNQAVFPERTETVQARIAPLKQAFSVLGNKVTRVQIARERWPLEPVHCSEFNVSYFKSAQFEACFRVRETIDYTWKKAVEVPAIWIS